MQSKTWFLSQIDDVGQSAGSDYYDGENVQGWFGFSIEKRDDKMFLVAHYAPSLDEGVGETQVREWELKARGKYEY